MLRIILFALILHLGTHLPAQNIEIKEEPKIRQMMDAFIANNKAKDAVEGWRIEILATTSRQEMDRVMESFQNKYPELPIDWVHANPYFKVRVGAFADKMEATRMLHALKEDYPAAYRVMDNKMRPEELLN